MADVIVYLSQELHKKDTTKLTEKMETILSAIYKSPVRATLASATMGQPDAMVIMSGFDKVADTEMLKELRRKAGWVVDNCVNLAGKKMITRISSTIEDEY